MARSYSSHCLSVYRTSVLKVTEIVPILLVKRGVLGRQGPERALTSGDDVQCFGHSEVEMDSA